MVRAVLAIAFIAPLSGCLSVGSDPPGPGSNNNPDGGTTGSVDAPKFMWPDAAPGSMNNLPCKNTVSPAPQLGHHNTGQSCMQSCHNHGFTVAGTLYTNDTGNTGFGGATISLTQNNGQVMELVVNNDGNFYTKATVSFPVLVIASACPSAVKMPLASSDGNCNKAGCHVGGSAKQMHLP
jgi:hypothetical protein